MYRFSALFFLIASINTSSGQESIFSDSKTCFVKIITDGDNSLGCHYKWADENRAIYDSVLICDTSVESIISISKEGTVNWLDIDYKSRGRKLTQEDTSLFAYHPKMPIKNSVSRYPLFRVVRLEDKIYYQNIKRPDIKILRYSLDKYDTVKMQELYELRHYENELSDRDSFWVYIVSDSNYNNIIRNNYSIYYIKDTIISIFNKQVPCYVFFGEESRNVNRANYRSVEILIEKKTLLPIFMKEKLYHQYFLYRKGDKNVMSDKLIRTYHVVPRGFDF